MTGKVQEPNEQSQQTVRLNIREQALFLQFHPNQNLNRHPNASLSKIVHFLLDPSDFHFFLFRDRPLSTLKTFQFVPLYPTDFALRTINFVNSGPLSQIVDF